MKVHTPADMASAPPTHLVAKLKCRDCGTVLNTSVPFERKDEAKVRLLSGLAAGRCPKGCRSTLPDLNLNTEIEIEAAP